MIFLLKHIFFIVDFPLPRWISRGPLIFYIKASHHTGTEETAWFGQSVTIYELSESEVHNPQIICVSTTYTYHLNSDRSLHLFVLSLSGWSVGEFSYPLPMLLISTQSIGYPFVGKAPVAFLNFSKLSPNCLSLRLPNSSIGTMQCRWLPTWLCRELLSFSVHRNVVAFRGDWAIQKNINWDSASNFYGEKPSTRLKCELNEIDSKGDLGPNRSRLDEIWPFDDQANFGEYPEVFRHIHLYLVSQLITTLSDEYGLVWKYSMLMYAPIYYNIFLPSGTVPMMNWLCPNSWCPYVPLIFQWMIIQWEFQDPKLEVPTIYNAYVMPKGNSHWIMIFPWKHGYGCGVIGSHGLAPGWPGEAWWFPHVRGCQRDSGRDPVHEKPPVFEVGFNGIWFNQGQ